MRTVISSRLVTNTVREVQAALRGRYRRLPESAWVTPIAWTEASGSQTIDPFRGAVRLGLAGRSWDGGVPKSGALAGTTLAVSAA